MKKLKINNKAQKSYTTINLWFAEVQKLKKSIKNSQNI